MRVLRCLVRSLIECAANEADASASDWSMTEQLIVVSAGSGLLTVNDGDPRVVVEGDVIALAVGERWRMTTSDTVSYHALVLSTSDLLNAHE
jgi:quercetin dioxygenase-like cupin family protein